MDDCTWPTGKHLWSIPEPVTGRQTCLWCPAVKWPEPIEHDVATQPEPPR